MKALNKITSGFGIMLALLIAGGTGMAQDARLQFEKLNGLESKARDVVEVNVDGKLLELAKRVTSKVNDDDAKKVWPQGWKSPKPYIRIVPQPK